MFYMEIEINTHIESMKNRLHKIIPNIPDLRKMGVMRFMVMIWAAVLTGLQGAPIEDLRADESIGHTYNETKKLLSHCTKVLKSICSHHSLSGCYDSVTQMQSRLASISLNSCDTNISSKIREEIHHSLHKLNVKKILNEIKKLDANSRATAESISESFASLSSHVTQAINTLENLSSKSSEIVSQPNGFQIITLNNILIVLLVVMILIVALKDCQMLISWTNILFRRVENSSIATEPNASESELVKIDLDTPIGPTEAPPTG